MAGTTWSAALAVAAVGVFAGALWVSGSFSDEARLMPRLVATCGLLAALVLVWQEVKVRRTAAGQHVPEPSDEPVGTGGSTLLATRVEPVVDQRTSVRAHDLRIAARTFTAMAAFLVLVMLGGYLAATLVFTPAFLLYAARARLRTTIVYTVVLGLVLLSLPSLLPVDLPMGLLQ
jgi:hypothetical protein